MSQIAEEFTWLDRIAADASVQPGAFKIAYTIIRHLNWKSREAWPSVLTIADRAGISERSVRRHIHELECKGYVAVARSSGRWANKYQIANPEILAGLNDAQPCQTGYVNPAKLGTQPCHWWPPNSKRTPKGTLDRHECEKSHSSGKPNGQSEPASDGEANHQTKGMRKPGSKKPARRRTAKPEPKVYAFKGKSLSLTKQDYDKWRKEFSRLPDFDRSLREADENYARKGYPPGQAFWTIHRWLAKENETAPEPNYHGLSGPCARPDEKLTMHPVTAESIAEYHARMAAARARTYEKMKNIP